MTFGEVSLPLPATGAARANEGAARRGPSLDAPNGFVEIYEAHYGRIAAYVHRRLGDRDLTEELTAEVFLRAYRARRSFRGEVPIVSWLLGIATNTVYRRVRRQRTEERALRLSGRDETVASVPDRRFEHRDELRSVRRAIDALPERQQAVVTLHCIEGIPLKEVAEALGIPPGTAKSRLSRARAALRSLLSDDREEEGRR